jgi:hypothetical protein
LGHKVCFKEKGSKRAAEKAVLKKQAKSKDKESGPRKV